MKDKQPKPIGNPWERLVRRLPVEFYPPYGYDREVFKSFLEGLPEGGIGIHATTTKHLDSIKQFGLDPGRSGESAYPEVHYEYLDPTKDHILTTFAGVRGEIATYYRLRNGISSVMQYYGIPKANWLTENESPETPYRPVLLLFSRASFLDSVTKREDEALLHASNEYPLGIFENSDSKKNRIAKNIMRYKSFIIPERWNEYNKGELASLEWGKGDSVPPEVIEEIFIMDNYANLLEFRDIVTHEIIGRYSAIVKLSRGGGN